jgi:hypothetical protein
MDFVFEEGKNEPDVDFYESFQYGKPPGRIRVVLRGSKSFCESHGKRIKFALGSLRPQIEMDLK